MASIKGCDLASLQGADGLPDPVWKRLAEDGHRFAYLRLLVGNEAWTDQATVRKNVERARNYGIAVSPYLFPYPLRHLRIEDQVDRFAKLAEGLGSEPGDLRPVWDGEWPPRESRAKDGALVYDWRDRWKVDASFLRDATLRGLERGRVLGLDFIFYSFRYWLQCVEAEKAPELGSRPLVLADYTFRSSVNFPTTEQLRTLRVPAPWRKIHMVQFDGDGGMRLPNGVDADFDVVPDEETFRELLVPPRALASDGEPAHVSLPDAGPPPAAEWAVDPSGLIAQASALLVEDGVEAYRKSRLEAEPPEA